MSEATMKETELALAYLRECGQDVADLEWAKEILQSDARNWLHQTAIDVAYRSAIAALHIVRGESHGRPEILEKIGAWSCTLDPDCLCFRSGRLNCPYRQAVL